MLPQLRRHLATSDDPLARAVRRLKAKLDFFEVPIPLPVAKAMRLGYEVQAKTTAQLKRVFIAQPIFRAYCKECGPNLRTDEFIHFVQGAGDIVCGRDVWLDGKVTITFANSYVDRPRLTIGDGSAIGNGCEIVIGKSVTIGKHVILSGDVGIFDSNGHPSDPVERRNKRPPAAEEVRPIVIGDDVWVGKHVIIFPGVRIGDGAIVGAGTVVRRHVPPLGVVAGNPAQLMFRLKKPVTDVAEKAAIADQAARNIG
jgi:acetyltransferase-like isoleucine patch superfamily enzyme